jgi:hypothetical protein
MDAAPRNAHLQVVTAWLDQLIDGRLALRVGQRLARWMRERVGDNMLKHVNPPSEVEWFGFACARWMLTAANHLGDLEAAGAANRELDAHTPRLAGRWEHAPLLLDALVARAVHLTDAWEPNEAATHMRAVDGYYGDLGVLFSAAMPSLFPDEVRSDVRARALGTWVQAELAVCAQDASRIGEARRISDLALREFDTGGDVRRQCQYRSHLELLAGEWQKAEVYLARGVGLEGEVALARIVSHIKDAEPRSQGFPLLHLLRLVARRALEGSTDDREVVARVLRESRVLTATRWTAASETELVDYPRHGVLRHSAVAAAATGDFPRSSQLIGALRGMVDVRTGPLALIPIVLAGLTEVGLLELAARGESSRRLLGKEKGGRLGAAGVASVLAERATRCGFNRIAARAQTWGDTLAAVAGEPNNEQHHTSLLQLARAIP